MLPKFGTVSIQIPVQKQVSPASTSQAIEELFGPFIQNPEDLDSFHIETEPEKLDATELTLNYTNTPDKEAAFTNTLVTLFQVEEGKDYTVANSSPCEKTLAQQNRNRLPLMQAIVEIATEHCSPDNICGLDDIDVTDQNTPLNKKGLVPFYKLAIKTQTALKAIDELLTKTEV